ncbi:MAG: nucleotide exchange factor GrpE [Sediminibacterium sp.]
MTEELNDNQSQELENNELNETPVEETSTEASVEATIEPTADQLVAEWKDKYVRLTADFENFRRQRNLERIELLKNASRDVIVDLLPVLDIFELGMKANETSEDMIAVKEGFSLIYGKLVGELEKKGLKPMESNGLPFNVDFHEAITEFPAPTEEQKNTVIDTAEKGYLLNGNVIRYAKVVVGK